MASSGDGYDVPLVMETCTFDTRQEQRLKEMERRLQDKVRKKKKEWEKEVEKMKVEFLHLYPSDTDWSEGPTDNSPVIKRKGSMDILDPDKMKTMFLEYPDAGYQFKLRFDMTPFDKKSVTIANEGNCVCVRAMKKEENDYGEEVEKEYVRKIEKPKHIDASKLKSSLTQDGILIIEAPLPQHSHNLRKYSHAHSPSQSSSHGSHGSSSHLSHVSSSRSRSPSGSPESPPGPPLPPPKYGVAQFVGADGEKVLSLMVDIGVAFKPKDIILQVCKDNVIQIKAKSSVKTPVFMSKHKFFKEYELSEKIETLSLRGGLTDNGKLMVAALSKGHPLFNVEEFSKAAKESGNINNIPCNILELAEFPIIHSALGNSNSNSNSGEND